MQLLIPIVFLYENELSIVKDCEVIDAEDVEEKEVAHNFVPEVTNEILPAFLMTTSLQLVASNKLSKLINVKVIFSPVVPPGQIHFVTYSQLQSTIITVGGIR